MPRSKKHRLAPSKAEVSAASDEMDGVTVESETADGEPEGVSGRNRVAATEDDARGGRLTPAMKQYFDVREKHPEALLLFQMGDFYETFFEDAQILAKTLSVTLTARGHAGGNPIPLAGFPIKALDSHLPKLVAAGLRVVLCEQIEEASKAKSVVERDVTRVLTAGTLVEDSMLDPTRPNYIAALVPMEGECGLAWIELSTGSFSVARVAGRALAALLSRIGPAELVVSDALADGAETLARGLQRQLSCALTEHPDWTFAPKQAAKALRLHFGVATLAGFGLTDEGGPEVCAAGALIMLLKEQQRAALTHITRLDVHHSGSSVPLDGATVAALELVETLRGRERKHTLLWALDDCDTSMGSRTLRQWLLAPLTNPKTIRLRHGAVGELLRSPTRRELVRSALKGQGDLGRLAGRLGCGRAVPRDLVGLGLALDRVPLLQNALQGCESELLAELGRALDPVSELRDLIQAAIKDEPAPSAKDGQVIRDGYDAELDRLREMQRDGRKFIAKYQAEAADSSGIPSVKIGYTSVFGYYLEVSNTHKDRVPATWIRKQTLTGRERYVTHELIETERQVLNADSEAQRLEAELVSDVRQRAAPFAGRVSRTADVLAIIDVLCSFARVAADRGYVMPEVTEGTELSISDGRHPVLDLTLEPGRMVPNDCRLGESATMAIITGPNMAGKSTYVRMCALLTLMCQCGSFVPASAMRLGVVDRLFTRLGSADEIQRGSSTFMVEMIETAGILNGATDRSLVILDEVGRGTSTYDGVSIAWAVSEHLARVTRTRTLFATHYHELTQLASMLPGVMNLNVAVKEWGEEIVFLHRIVEGAADRSYGIHVARLAGLPRDVVARAKEIMGRLEAEAASAQSGIGPSSRAETPKDGGPKVKPPKRVQLTLFSPMENKVLRKLAELDVERASIEVLRAEVANLRALASDELAR